MIKIYNILDLQKMDTIELASIADQHGVVIQNGFKQGLIYAILDKQASTGSATRQPSELNARDRYAVADRITAALKSKTAVIAVMAMLVLSSCATMKPKSAALRKAVRKTQQENAFMDCSPANRDALRQYRLKQKWPYKMTRIPLTRWYIK